MMSRPVTPVLHTISKILPFSVNMVYKLFDGFLNPSQLDAEP